MNINKLKGKIVENGMNVEKLAEEIGTSTATLYRVMQTPEKITVGMASEIKNALKLSNEDAIEIFLT